jgi:hypothetical protein
MKTMIALGLAISSLLLVMALRGTSTSPYPVPQGEPDSAESQSRPTAAHTRNVASHALQATPPVAPIQALLLEADEAETDSDRRSQALARVVESMSDAELPAILDSLACDISADAAELRQLLVHRWAETNAPAAAAWATQLPEGPARRAALEQVAITWANADLPATASWVRTLPEDDGKQAATLGLAYEAVRTEPVMAIDLASTSSPTRERDDLLVHSVSQWAGTDSAAAADWAASVPDSSLRQHLLAAVAVASAEQDGAAAATLAVDGLIAGEAQDRAVVSIVQRWVQNSPQAAASWVSQFPGLPSREPAVQNLLALWTTQDAEAAGNWLRELPAGPVRNLGIAAYDQALTYRVQTSAAVPPAGGL